MERRGRRVRPVVPKDRESHDAAVARQRVAPRAQRSVDNALGAVVEGSVDSPPVASRSRLACPPCLARPGQISYGAPFALTCAVFLGVVSSVLWTAVCLGGRFWQTWWEQRLYDFERDNLPGLDFFSADTLRIRYDVKQGLSFHRLVRDERFVYAAVMRKPSVSYAMIILAGLFTLSWIILTVSFMWQRTI